MVSHIICIGHHYQIWTWLIAFLLGFCIGYSLLYLDLFELCSIQTRRGSIGQKTSHATDPLTFHTTTEEYKVHKNSEADKLAHKSRTDLLEPQRIQSTSLSVQPSESGPATPSPASECCSPLWAQGTQFRRRYKHSVLHLRTLYNPSTLRTYKRSEKMTYLIVLYTYTNLLLPPVAWQDFSAQLDCNSKRRFVNVYAEKVPVQLKSVSGPFGLFLYSQMAAEPPFRGLLHTGTAHVLSDSDSLTAQEQLFSPEVICTVRIVG